MGAVVSKLDKETFVNVFEMYHRTNVLSFKERSPQKKKYSNSKLREKNIAVVSIRL